MRSRRRLFLKWALGGAAAGLTGASWWAATSNARSARWLRRLAEDSQRTVLPAAQRPRPETWSDNAITLSWLGHATVLLNFYGVRILTDPALHSRVGVGVGIGTLGPKRYIASALRFRDLPPIDLLLLSHAHMDHLDLPTLQLFPSQTEVVSAPLTQDLLADAGLRRVQELRWGQTARVRTPAGEVEVGSFEVKHWGQRWPGEPERGYSGYWLRREGKTLLFGGDTALTPRFRELQDKGPFEAAIMPIGAYRPWIRNHCTPEEALQMANEAGARYVVAMHHQTFKLSEEPMEEPIERLAAAMQTEPERLGLRAVGETFVVPG